MGRLGIKSRELGLAGEAALGEAALGEALAGSLMGERAKREGRMWCCGGCLVGSGRRTPFSGR